MFRNTVQPSPISLFSSTSSNPFSLFSVHVDSSLPEDSGCLLLQDDTDRRIDIPSNDATLLYRDPRQFKLRSKARNDATEEHQALEKESVGREPRLLTQAVLHLQSPTIDTTFIRSPPLPPPKDIDSFPQTYFKELGLKNPRIHFQLRPLGSRPFVLEIGVKDVKNQLGRIRVSNFQARPTLYLFSRKKPRPSRRSEDLQELPERRSPLLHLPLSVPSLSENNNVLTEWSSFSLDLPYLMPHLHDPSILSFETAKAMSGDQGEDDGEEENPEVERSPPLLIPFDRFESVAYVKVHANCRLRRIYLTDSNPESQNLNLDEFEIYGAEEKVT